MVNRDEQAQRDWFVGKVKEILNKKKFPFDDVVWDKQPGPGSPVLVIKSGKENHEFPIRDVDLLGKPDGELEQIIEDFIDFLIAGL